MNNKNYLTCKSVRFYGQKDEDAFFEWIKKIDCVKHFEGAGNELYLDLVDRPLTDTELLDFIALFYRYKIDLTQLCRFITSDNEQWVAGKPYGYWHRRMFAQNKNVKL